MRGEKHSARKFTSKIPIDAYFDAFFLYLCAMKRIFLLLFALIVLCAASAQRDRRFRIMEYNCENLFDTLHDAGKDDHEFLPTGQNLWGTYRYWAKQGALARVILEAGGLQPVDLVGMCEVENDSVLRDLTRRTRLAALGYEYVVSDSRDLRGVDVALLYQPYTFRLVDSHCYRVPYDAGEERPTRDILHCAGVLPVGDTLDVILVHFPSRRGGANATAPYRQRAAEVVSGVADSLQRVRRRPLVVVMGDCNDEPSDRSLQTIAQAGFVNFAVDAQPDGANDWAPMMHYIEGTYYYQREWSRIDNVLVGRPAVERFRPQPCTIFCPDYLLEADRDGFPMPFRTYRGPAYHGGTSDHLPLLLDLWY